MTTTKTELTRPASTIVRVLEMTMQGVTPEDISGRLGIKHVREIQNAHGYPNERLMLDQVRQLLPLKNLDVTFDVDRAETEPPTAPGQTAATAAPAPSRPAPARPDAPPAAVQTVPVDELQRFLLEAQKHPRPAVANEAARILDRIAKLREAISQVDADQKRLAEIRDLEARLDELRAAAGIKSRTKARGEYPCGDCGRVATTGAGLAAHRRSAHGGAS